MTVTDCLSTNLRDRHSEHCIMLLPGNCGNIRNEQGGMLVWKLLDRQ
jgi:hypothetical protein